jgi:hypothetical protein
LHLSPERQVEEPPSSPSHNNENDNEPPFSRVFIVCGRSISGEELMQSFSKFGRVESCKIITDKLTKESKGVAYIKFDKASSAALAIENLHGKQISEYSPPLKVMIAEMKGAKQQKPIYTEAEDLPPRSRLFIVCSKVRRRSLTVTYIMIGNHRRRSCESIQRVWGYDLL